MIRSEAKGEIIDIENCGTDTLVRKYPPSQKSSEQSTQPLSIYSVRREKQLDGEETLHWTFLGDVPKQSTVECEYRGEGISHDNEGA
ncbi:hypothetical protein C486_03419 [Natrinema gari JCM 14663]|uniref:Uncharacterized protein n=2 Tax=Natrinema gari TaxID=419186 RepID=L9ZCL2_9EURY|nr:hypothetical protein C486_03419 [Natrinema gari JCM 14663]